MLLEGSSSNSMPVMILLLAWSTPADTNSSKAASIRFSTVLIGFSVVPLHGQLKSLMVSKLMGVEMAIVGQTGGEVRIAWRMLAFVSSA